MKSIRFTSLIAISLLLLGLETSAGVFPSVLAQQPDPQTVVLPCAQATLQELITCIVEQMPGKGSEGFHTPQQETYDLWVSLVTQLLAGPCQDVVVPEQLIGIYTVFPFIDSSDRRPYCVLMEVLAADQDGAVERGWGTVIVNYAYRRPLHIQISHPKHDLNTAQQGLGVFKATEAFVFTMAGMHRHANAAASACQAEYAEADAAHNDMSLLQAATLAIEVYSQQVSITTIQFHGKSNTACTGIDVFMTYGTHEVPEVGDSLTRLRDAMRTENPSWTVEMPGSSASCSLFGSDNVQGRLINGVAAHNACEESARHYSGRFIHIEQNRSMRDATYWTAAIGQTWPPL